MLVEVRSPSGLVDVKSDWLGQSLQFWPVGSDEKVRRALLGIDLEQPAGKYDLTLNAQTESGEQVSCSAVVSVRAGTFAVEKLRVGQQFVEPSPKDLERAKNEQQRLKELFAQVTPERLWQGSFRVPVSGARAAKNFGRRRILNGEPRTPHSGEDFPAVAGTPVHAAQRGRVVLAEELFFSGNTVVLDHGLGLYTFYGHLESISVKVGDVVKAGGLLGRVGATGRATGPHLHWGVDLNGARVNPLQLVALTSERRK
jgi:murein DD-endopeptidase MepM/ murein hydrolase activator NlpD